MTGLGALAVAVLAVALAVAARLLFPGAGGARAWSSRRFWLLVGVAVVLARTAYVAEWGSDLPYQDQWNAEGQLLVAPAVDGTLAPGALLARHSEHLVVFTRLTTLALLDLTGVWDATGAQLVVAALAGAIVGLLGARLAHALRLQRRDELLLAGVALALFATPLAWENILGGFQTQVLFSVLFGVAALAGATDPRAAAPWRAALTLAAAGCAMASFAPGALASVALFLVAHLERRGERPGPAALSWLALGGALVFIATTPHLPHLSDHAHLRPATLGELGGATTQALAWPARPDAPLLRALLGLVWWSPLAGLVVRLRGGGVAPALRPGARLVVGLGLWAGLVLAAAVVARGRGGAAVVSRYTELYALGTLANAAALLLLVRGRGGAARAGAAAWLALLCVCLACEVRPAAGLAAYRWSNQREQLAIARAVVDGADVSGVDTRVLWGITLDDLERSLVRTSARERLPWSVRPCALDATRRLAYEVPRATAVEPAGRVVLGIDRARTVFVMEDERAAADLVGRAGVRGPIPVSALEVAWLRVRAARLGLAGVCGLMLLAAPAVLWWPLRLRRRA